MPMRDLLKRFAFYYRPHRALFALDFSSAVAAGLLELAFPVAVTLFIDRLLPTGRLDLIALARLDFEAPDRATFRCLDLAYRALDAGGSATTVLNAANEEAVAAFLDGGLPFPAIAETIERCLDGAHAPEAADLASLLDVDLTARRQARRIIATLSGRAASPHHE